MPSSKTKGVKSASFHGRIPLPENRNMRRPKTQPDLLADRRSTAPSSFTERGRSQPLSRVPSKVLLNVTLQRSLWSVQVVASPDWKVHDVIAASLRLYVKEGRRPLLPFTDPALYGLHYSQFSLECLDPEEKLIGLGSRNFFLCPKEQQVDLSSSAATPSCSNQAMKTEAPKVAIFSWFKFMTFLQ